MTHASPEQIVADDVTDRTTTRSLVTLAVVLALSGCARDGDALGIGPPASQINPVAVGDPVTAVLVYLELRDGDRLELLGAEPSGSLDGAAIRFLVSTPVADGDDLVIGEEFEPLEGALVTFPAGADAPERTIGVAAELTAARPGRFEVTSVRLRYRLNGGAEQVAEGIDVRWTVCADLAPSDCTE